ncbi:MAG: hypothetical protein MUP66_01590 [Candidatus Nanohaloarchaeota archaeon QJJ-5]|nr:hypothetical protein [Candidatus Nanohaloarchaeota archaeon QJJ-5]
MSIPHEYTQYLIWLGLGPAIWYLGVAGHNAVIPTCLLVIIFLPTIHAQTPLPRKALSYSSIVAAVIFLSTIAAYLYMDLVSVLLLGILTGTMGAFWIWAVWLYVEQATALVQAGRFSEDLIGFGVVPVFTGIPLGVVFLAIGGLTGQAWSLIVGHVLLLFGAAVLYFLLRAEE